MDFLTEEQLKVLSLEDISKIIANVKRAFSRIKNKMEAPLYDNIEKYPERIELLKKLRSYLELAKNKLIEKGGKYQKSTLEVKDEEFNSTLETVSKIHFAFAGPKYTDDSVFIDLSTDPPIMLRAISEQIKERKHKWTKSSFIEEFKNLHVGEWADEYSLSRYGLKKIGGSHWLLSIEYYNGKRKIYRGTCAYPYNFDELLAFFRIG